MKHLKKILVSILAIILTHLCYAENAAITNPSLAPMLKKVMPSVVNISVRGEIPLPNLPMFTDKHKFNPRFEDLGSGVIIDAEKGYIVTNAHVIKDAQVITITLSDGRSMRAKIIGHDTPSDIALLQITAKRLKSATFGDSDKLKIGDFVCAIGSPFGLQQTVTSGVISGLERSEPDLTGNESFIQTDASINLGSSGGALVNMRGELVGINTAIVAPLPINAGIGLAVPSNTVKSITNQLSQYGKVKRGFIGIIAQNITPALAEALKLRDFKEGALISEVIPGSPAANAGLRSKDVIVKIMGNSAHSAAQIRNTTTLSPIGSKVELQIQRDNKLINLAPIVANSEDLKKSAQETSQGLLFGLMLRNFNQLVNNNQIKGVEILYVDDTSTAYSCGLLPGDVILSAANQKITTITELQKIAGNNSKQLLLEIKRRLGGNLFLVLEE